MAYVNKEGCIVYEHYNGDEDTIPPELSHPILARVKETGGILSIIGDMSSTIEGFPSHDSLEAQIFIKAAGHLLDVK